MLDEHCNPWVIKLQTNPQHRRVLINEFLACRLAERIGLAVPEVKLFYTSETGDISHGNGTPSEPQCGIRYAGGMLPGLVRDWRAGEQPLQVRNQWELYGIALFDLWVQNTDSRQLVLARTYRQRLYKAVFIDQGYCFGGTDWDLDVKGGGLRFARTCTNFTLESVGTFHKWLKRINAITMDDVSAISSSLPTQWLQNENACFATMLTLLLERRDRLHYILFSAWEMYKEGLCATQPAIQRSFDFTEKREIGAHSLSYLTPRGP